MAYVVTDACIKDFVCVTECATAGIAPMENGSCRRDRFAGLYRPRECIKCGNCATLCAQNAICLEEELPANKMQFAEKNKAYFS